MAYPPPSGVWGLACLKTGPEIFFFKVSAGFGWVLVGSASRREGKCPSSLGKSMVPMTHSTTSLQAEGPRPEGANSSFQASLETCRGGGGGG